METTDINKPHKIFAEVVDFKAMDQFRSAMNQPFSVKGALMPDVHCGYSLPIGSVVATQDVIVPAWVGYDIGCGMCALPTTYSVEEVSAAAQKIFTGIYEVIPVGFNHNSKATAWPEADKLPKSTIMKEIFDNGGLYHLGTLGGGNHFIEIGHSEDNIVWIIIHSGSRGIGHSLAKHYMSLASGGKGAKEGHFGLSTNSTEGKSYIDDLNFCLAFALENRLEMMRRVTRVIESQLPGKANWDILINRNHNHAEQKDGLWIHRKGATHAEKGMMGVIPGNMFDGSFIVRGKGNPDSLWSSSHGAGRVLGRGEAKRTLSIVDFSEIMQGITAKVSEKTIDESPFAYKDIFTVMAQQESLLDVVAHVKPIINIKG